MNITNVMGALPTFNAQHTCIEGAEKISGEYIREHRLIKDNTCHACPVACKKMVEVHINGKTIRFESYEYESAWALGAHSGHTDTDWTGYAIYLCNAYGMDTIEAGNAIAVLMEATEKGYYQGEDGIRFGDKEGEIRVLEAIAYRKGVGDMLAEGPARFAKAIGHPEIALEVKGQSIPAYDPRGLKGMGIAYATSNRGACHLRAYTPASEILGVPYKTDPLAWEGKGKLTKLFQDLSAFTDSLDLCKFSQFAEGPEEYAKQLAAYWGRPVTPEEILRIGERIYNLERYYNNLAGWGEGSDYLPERFLKEPRLRGLQGPGHRAGPDAGGVLPGAGLGAGRGSPGQAPGARHPLPGGGRLALPGVAPAFGPGLSLRLRGYAQGQPLRHLPGPHGEKPAGASWGHRGRGPGKPGPGLPRPEGGAL